MIEKSIVCRRVTDLAKLLLWRKEVLETVFGMMPTQELMEANERYYAEEIAKSGHLALEALYNGEEAGCGAICLQTELPSPDNPSGRCAYLMNIYVRPAFRRKGVAANIVETLVKEAKAFGCDKIYLETTDMARNLYLAHGFRTLPDILKLD